MPGSSHQNDNLSAKHEIKITRVGFCLLLNWYFVAVLVDFSGPICNRRGKNYNLASLSSLYDGCSASPGDTQGTSPSKALPELLEQCPGESRLCPQGAGEDSIIP